MKDARRQRGIGFAQPQGVLEVLRAARAAAGDHRQRATGLHLATRGGYRGGFKEMLGYKPYNPKTLVMVNTYTMIV